MLPLPARSARVATAGLVVGAVALGVVGCTPAGQGRTVAPLNLRSGASTADPVLTVIPLDTSLRLQCLATGEYIAGPYPSEAWAKVSYGTRTGYVSRAFLAIESTTTPGPCSGPAPASTTRRPVEAVQPATGGGIARTEIVRRAMTWVDRRVPYSSDLTASGPGGGTYRTDSAGFVSMALNLSRSETSTTLIDHVVTIGKADLVPGDLVGNLGEGRDEVVVVFNGWLDERATRFRSLELTVGNAASVVRSWGDGPATSRAWRYRYVEG